MSKLVRCAALVAALTVVFTVAFSAADAQDKGKSDGPAGIVEVYKAKDGYRFRVKGSNGKGLAQSSTKYDKKEDAVKAVETLKEILNSAKVIDATK
jgi:uncharacterized protein YegP (UPF0339 family)